MICSAPFASAIKPASANLGAVKVLFVRVSVPVTRDTVPVASGIVIVLSAVGSVTVIVVSLASAVAPSITIDASESVNPETVGEVKVLLVRVSVVALPTIVSVPVGKVRLDSVEPLPSLVYSSTKLSLILSPPVLRSSPVPSFAEEPRPSA